MKDKLSNIMKDHNKERIYERAKTAFEDVEASKYINNDWSVYFYEYERTGK